MSETPLHTFSRSCTSIKYTFNKFLLSELLLNKKLFNIYLIRVDERDICHAHKKIVSAEDLYNRIKKFELYILAQNEVGLGPYDAWYMKLLTRSVKSINNM